MLRADINRYALSWLLSTCLQTRMRRPAPPASRHTTHDPPIAAPGGTWRKRGRLGGTSWCKLRTRVSQPPGTC
ncbi:hypothetical protein B0H10DRAFT_2129180 [Mycena sp. CBHHK59/15]|nr:hypothetical protein B0H10DRAFT_2129180 [Mycena sp. CBHHK59/15]